MDAPKKTLCDVVRENRYSLRCEKKCKISIIFYFISSAVCCESSTQQMKWNKKLGALVSSQVGRNFRPPSLVNFSVGKQISKVVVAAICYHHLVDWNLEPNVVL